MQTRKTRESGKSKISAEDPINAVVQEPAVQLEAAPPSSSWAEKISKISIVLLAALLPLWFLPFTQDALGYQKQILLVALAFLGVLAWLADVIGRQEIILKKHPAHVALVFLLGAFGISSAFSLWRYGSFWGFPFNITDSAVTLLGFSLLYILVSHVYKEVKGLAFPYALVLCSVFLAAAFALVQMFGIFLLPFAFSRVGSFNTMGSVNGVALIVAALVPLAVMLAFLTRSLLRWISFGIIAFFAVFLALVNFFDAWVVLLIGLLVLLAFGMWGMKKTAFGWVSLPVALTALALFFLLFRIQVPFSPRVPVEISPSAVSEIDIAKNVLRERPLTGSGPGTFGFDYARHHSRALNQTAFWNTRFPSGSSELFDWVLTKGILGALALLCFIALILRAGLKTLLASHDDHKDWMIALGSTALFAASAASLALYPASFIMWFLFWISASALVVASANGRRVFSIVPPSRLALGISSAFLFTLIFGLGFLYIQGQKYAADITYMRGVSAFQEGNAESAIRNMAAAVTLNPSVDAYWRDLAQVYLARIGTVSSNEALSKEQKQQELQNSAANALAAGKRAADLSPNNVANWNVLGFVYRNLIGVPGAEQFALSSYEKASALEPVSPFPWTELARVYLLSGQSLASNGETKAQSGDSYEKALAALAKAIELKPDYAPAHFLAATVYERQGRGEEASKKLKEIARINPGDTGVAFQLGVVYWQKGDFENARLEFERAKALNPSYANARYMLGLVYDRQGRAEAAEKEFTAVLNMAPDNEEIKKILANIASGNPALQGIVPGQPPVSDNPPEIKKSQAAGAEDKERTSSPNKKGAND